MTQNTVFGVHDAASFWLLFAWALLTGAALGSFVGLVVDRLPRQESIISPRSRCTACGHRLTAYDMVPIASWLWLRGRCRRCGVGIGVRALWVECAMAGLSAAFVLRLGLGTQLLLWWPLSVCLVAIALLDIDWFWVPDELSLPALAWATLCMALPGNVGWRQGLLGLLPALCLWLLAFAYEKVSNKEAMGLGDIKLLAVMGVALGPMPTLLALTLAAVLGAVTGTLALLTGQGHRQAAQGAAMPVALAHDAWTPPHGAVPFGPFLVLAAFAMVLAPAPVAGLLLWLPERLASLAV